MFDYLDGFSRMLALLQPGSDIAAYGRYCLSRPHRSDRKKKGGRKKAQRRARNKRLREAKM